ncbi:unnamed protein product [Mytilus edulis]|uniref:CCHC-type domain-containing protein n=1 Tax=Mytilus edulis TaxID=6550 RepID=A0A8S3VME5_MYTED|nr:unnamed protein product [Mytilus edulis]
MSEEEISVVEPLDESQLLKDDESDLTTADAVSLFNSSLNKALQRQKNKKGFKYSSILTPTVFLHLRTSELLDQTLDLQSIVKTELDTLNQRNKILKIADRHEWDTVREYLDDPLADSVEDASKLRTAVFRANSKRTANKPYSRGGGRGGFNARDFFRGFSKESGPRNDNYNQQNSQQQYNDGLCFYCKRPGHTARFYPYKAHTFSSTKSAPATITSAPPLS